MEATKAPTIDPNTTYTYADYCTWDDDVRRELIDGVMYVAEPGASYYHQSVGGNIYFQLASFLRGKPQKVLLPPFDILLHGKGDNEKTVVQPDIVVFCDRSKLDDKKGNGAPDMAIEVLSKYSLRHDKLRKFDAYLRAGVREYWIVDPKEKTVLVNILQDGEYIPTTYTENEIAPVHVLEGCEINLADVFAD
jgi:Uma2 family endonuclease